MSWLYSKKKVITPITAAEAKKLTLLACEARVDEATDAVIDWIFQDIQEWIIPRGNFHKTYNIEGILIGKYIVLSKENRLDVASKVMAKLVGYGYKVQLTEISADDYELEVDWS